MRDPREIEVCVLGNDAPLVSVPGEIFPSREFYSYEAKYIDGSSELLIPAPISAELSRRSRIWRFEPTGLLIAPAWPG